MIVKVHLTNYRIIIEPVSKDVSFKGKDSIDGGIEEYLRWFEKQPKYVRSFFEVPFGQVLKISGDLNQIKLTTRDQREFKLVFT